MNDPHGDHLTKEQVAEAWKQIAKPNDDSGIKCASWLVLCSIATIVAFCLIAIAIATWRGQ